ncbi:hypothetical protein BU23DRAFT_597540 [Bimuria novae-zelandiae CBS 107.79]|uniref:Uncharacterized protein n=1 Tax=Bimuria novae-zelandiae CBS 107.79 TaxID=1447943 RepID=A0A6A5VJ09_9PLEO|nr:hypothetical protein BU23DRAFT_597540 [Bimuria novae-zelandiae CBS 107.79]
MPKVTKEVPQYIQDSKIVENALVELRRVARPNVTAYCRDRNISHLRQRVTRALRGLNNKSTRPAANKRLSDEQESALERFCDAIDDVGFGLSPFCPEQVITPLRAQEAARAAEEATAVDCVQEPSTPTWQSSDEEDGDDVPAVLQCLSPPTHSRLLHQLLGAMGTPLFTELSQPFQTPQPRQLPSDIGWSTPKTIRTLNLQEKAIAYTLKKWLPREQAEDVISTLKGSSAMARNAARLEQALHQTKAAEHARAERRRRNQRIVNVGGGPVYAGDCQKMAAKRVINEAAKQEAAVAARHQKALIKQFNTWKRILSNRGKFRARRSIMESSIPALEVAYVNGGGMDPYTRHLQQKGDAPTLSSFPEEKQAIIQVQDSQFHVHKTQLEVTPIGSDDEGYSSPILEFYNAISPGQADWACER